MTKLTEENLFSPGLTTRFFYEPGGLTAILTATRVQLLTISSTRTNRGSTDRRTTIGEASQSRVRPAAVND